MPKTEMLINHVAGEECRIAIVEDGLLEELYQERQSNESHVGNIYKGRVSNVEPSIQAAFIDFGLERNGFLHITDLHPRYFPGKDHEETERVGKKTPHRHRPPIQQCLKRGQEILVQVIKEGIGTKGPTLSSYLSIAGRYLVMMPHMERLGVSRKVEDEDLRRTMRKTLDELEIPEGFGFIIRTAGIGKSKTDLKRDLSYLQRLWKAIDRRMAQPGVGELYTEQDLVIRTLRDIFTTDIERIVVDDPGAAKRASDFLAIASPRARSKVLYYSDPVPLYDRFGIERQIETIQAREVPLKSGGSLVIDSTEALVAIDVNSGKMRQHKNAETTAYKTNQEACDEVCRQLRLRDLGGVVVVDLIDMRESNKRRSIETQFRDNLKKDRARTKVLNISQLGLLEMTRQRMRPSLNKSVYNDCAHCHGSGHVKSVESVMLEAMRRLTVVMSRADIERVEIIVSPDVAFQLLNRRRADMVRMEQQFNTQVLVRVNGAGPIDFIELAAFSERGPVTPDGKELKGEPTLTAVAEMTDEELAEMNLELELEEQKAAEAEAADGKTKGDSDAEQSSEASESGESGEDEKPKRKRRRRRRRRGKSTDTKDEAGDAESGESQTAEGAESTGDHANNATTKDEASEAGESRHSESNPELETGEVGEDGEPIKKKKRRRRRRRRGKKSSGTTEDANAVSDEQNSESQATGEQESSEKPANTDDKPDKQPSDKSSDQPAKDDSTQADQSPPDAVAPDHVTVSADDDSETVAEAEKAASKKKTKKKRAPRRKKSASKAATEKAAKTKAGDAKSGDAESGDAKAVDTVAATKPKKKVSKKKTVSKRSSTRKVYPPPAARRTPD